LIVVLVLGCGAGAKAKSKASRSETAAAASTNPSTGSLKPIGGDIGSFDVVTAAQIAATAAIDVRAALSLVPTLVIDDLGGAAGLVTLSLRGSTSGQVLVLVDGHRVSRQPSAAFNLNDLAVTVERIARIEVTPAPASLVYGLDAVGGVVNVITSPAGVTPSIGVSYGRGAEAEQRIAGGVQYGSKKLGLRFDGQLLTGDGYRDNGDADQKNFTLGLAVDPAPWGLDVRWTSLNRTAGVPGPVAYVSPEARRQDKLDGLRADVRYKSGGGWDVKAGVFTRSQELRLDDQAPPVVDPLVATAPIAHRQDNSSVGVEAQMNIDTKKGELFTVGAEWVDDKVDGLGDEDHAAERWSIYTQDQWRQGDWSAVGVLRRDEHSEYGGKTNPSLSVGWGSGGWKLWAAWARNFRTPSFDDLYWDEQFLKGNPDLEPESSESYDGGIEIGGEWGRVRLSAFQRKVKNLISWTDSDGDLVYQPVNVAEATVNGWEATVLYRPSASISIPVGYQQLSTKDEETGGSLPGAVHGLWRAAIQGNGTKLTWSIEYAVTDRGEYQLREGGWSYTVVNAAVGWRDTIAKVPVQVSLRAENLQDTDYETVEGYPMRGRSWFAEVKVGL
jgi:outer membrane cobalamin receptor